MRNQRLLLELSELGHQVSDLSYITGEVMLREHNLAVTGSSLVVLNGAGEDLEIEVEWDMPHPWALVGTTPEGDTYAFLENGELGNRLQFLCGVRDNATSVA